MAELNVGGAQVSASVKLEESEYFDTYVGGAKVQVRDLHVIIDETGLRGNGKGIAYKKDGTLGTSVRTLYTLPQLPLAIRNAVVAAAAVEATDLANALNAA